MQNNLADVDRFESKRTELGALLLAEMKRLDDPYRFDEGYINQQRKISKQTPQPKKKSKVPADK